VGGLLENLRLFVYATAVVCVCGFRRLGWQNCNATTGLLSKACIHRPTVQGFGHSMPWLRGLVK
jgi:hypothetical protein